MSNDDYGTQWAQANGISVAVPANELLENPDCLQFIIDSNRRDESGFKEELTKLLAIDSNEMGRIRQLEQQISKELTRGFDPKDPEIFKLQSELAGLRQSQKMAPHMRQNLQGMIDVHSRLAQRAEQQLLRVRAIKSRGDSL